LPSGCLSILSRKGTSRSAECGGDGVMWNSPVNYKRSTIYSKTEYFCCILLQFGTYKFH